MDTFFTGSLQNRNRELHFTFTNLTYALHAGNLDSMYSVSTYKFAYTFRCMLAFQMSVVIKCWITMMLLLYHGMVPVQYLCDIGAVTDRSLCNLIEIQLALIQL